MIAGMEIIERRITPVILQEGAEFLDRRPIGREFDVLVPHPADPKWPSPSWGPTTLGYRALIDPHGSIEMSEIPGLDSEQRGSGFVRGLKQVRGSVLVNSGKLLDDAGLVAVLGRLGDVMVTMTVPDLVDVAWNASIRPRTDVTVGPDTLLGEPRHWAKAEIGGDPNEGQRGVHVTVSGRGTLSPSAETLVSDRMGLLKDALATLVVPEPRSVA